MSAVKYWHWGHHKLPWWSSGEDTVVSEWVFHFQSNVCLHLAQQSAYCPVLMDIVSWKLHYISLHNKHGCQTHIKWNQFILYGQCILNEINVLWVWWQKGSRLVMHLGIWDFSCKGSFCLVGLREGLFIKYIFFCMVFKKWPLCPLSCLEKNW